MGAGRRMNFSWCGGREWDLGQPARSRVEAVQGGKQGLGLLPFYVCLHAKMVSFASSILLFLQGAKP